MKNVEIQVKGTDLLIKVDMSKDFGPSKSGKTIVIASTEGNQKVHELKGKGIVLGLNCYTK